MRILTILFIEFIFCGDKKDYHKMHQVANAEPIYSCPDGYTLEEEKCLKTLKQPLVPACSEGIIQADNTCLIIKPTVKQCPKDFIGLGSVCTRTQTVSAMLQCPDGFLFDGLHNGHGHNGNTCIKTIHTPQFGCPDGAMMQDDHCITETTVPAVLECPDGTILQGLSCAKIETYECSTQYGKSNHNKLRKLFDQIDYKLFEQPITMRDLGKKKMKDQIITDVIALPQKVQQQTCQRTVLVPAIANCNEGVLVGRQCIIPVKTNKIELRPLTNIETAAPTAICPDNFVACGSNGKKKSSTDCCFSEEIKPTYSCISGYQLVNDQCKAVRKAELVCLSSGYHKHHNQNECISTQYIDPIISYHAEAYCQGKECETLNNMKEGHGIKVK